jgi:nitroreductase
MSMSRRLFLASSTIGLGAAALPAAAQSETATGTAAVSLEEALRRRESIRLYTDEPVAEDQLLRLLWAGYGINRPDIEGRTAPSARTAVDVDIYVATADAVRRYDPVAETLEPFLDADVREAGTAAQRFVQSAPVVLIYVSDREKLVAAGYDAEDEANLVMTGRVNTAFIAQNVYLFAAAEGLGTCVVGGIQRGPLEEALGFDDGRFVTFIQPVGHPR